MMSVAGHQSVEFRSMVGACRADRSRGREADVVHERVEPDVGDEVRIERQLDPPLQPRLRARDAEVAAQFLDGVAQFAATEIGDRSDRRANRSARAATLCARRGGSSSSPPRETRPVPTRAELAIGAAFLVGEELLLAHAVVAGLLVLVDFPFVPKPLQDALHAVLWRGSVVAAQPSYLTPSFSQKRDELRGGLVDEFLRRDALFLGRLLDLLPVLIDAGEEENSSPFSR